MLSSNTPRNKLPNMLLLEKSLSAMILPVELMSTMGGSKHQPLSVRRNAVIAALKKIKLAEGETANDAPRLGTKLSNVALNGILKSQNIIPTKTRLLMMKILFQRQHHQHITAEDIFKKICNEKKETKDGGKKKPPAISLASIYNCLNLFVAHGLLARHEFPHLFWGKKKSATVFYDTNIVPHHHVIDRLSRRIYDIPLDILAFDKLIEQASTKIRNETLIPKKLWRADGIKRNVFIAPLVFVLE